ncbi:restriction endonuclease subunit S [Enterococcus faecalis]|uniref:restriction endonuclease subunit S n=1 Tax=Enterococcus faecalis TaxID=1351 RepID=UPI00210BC94F|nr:restriction endonuclease subunit S [Enterococcus faecalis]
MKEITERVKGNDGRMDLPTLTISAGQGWLNQKDRFSGNIAGKEQKNYTLLLKNELSYNHGNSKLAKYGAVFSLKTYEEALVPRVYHSFKSTKNSDPDFLEYIFATKKPDKELGKLVSSGARMDGLLNINYDDFSNIKINIPHIHEQKKISNLLRKIDNTITLHQRKLDQLKELKKAYLQVMFPGKDERVPKLRFAAFEEGWELRKLGDITKISTGKLDANAMVENGKYDFYTSGIKKYRIDVPAFEGPAITIAGNGATVGYMHLADNKFNAYQRTYVLQEFVVDRSFLFSEVGNKLPKKINQEARTGNIPYIVMDMLTELKLSIPQDEAEQSKIGSFFKQIDKTIALHQNKLEQLKDLKTSYLQNMFI